MSITSESNPTMYGGILNSSTSLPPGSTQVATHGTAKVTVRNQDSCASTSMRVSSVAVSSSWILN